MVLQFRNDEDDRLRHARRVDARVRGYVVARLSGFHELESQRHAAHVRDVRQRRREHDAAHDRRRSGRRGAGGSCGGRTGDPARPTARADVVDGAGAAARGSGHRWCGSGGARRRDDGARMVPSAASATQADLEHAQQHELHGDGGALGPRIDRRHPEDGAGEFLSEEPQLDRFGVQGCALRLRLPGEPEGPDAGRVHRQRAAQAGDRSGRGHR